MWKRLPDAEVELRRREIVNEGRGFIKPIVYGFLAATVLEALFVGGYRIFVRPELLGQVPYHWGNLRSIATVGTALTLLIYYVRRKSANIADASIQRCRQCLELSPVNSEFRCVCGGTLEPSEYFTWDDSTERTTV